MAGTNVGNLNATLSLSEFEFTHGLELSTTAAMEFAGATEGAANRADRAIRGIGKGGFDSGGAARAVQQLGFGIQDFASQFDTRGLAGGIGAVTNNVQVLGAAFGPVGLAVSAFGGAIAGILIPKLIESSGWFKDNAKDAAAFGEQWKKTAKEITSARVMERDALKSPVKEFDDKQQGRRDRMSDINAEVDLLNKQITALQAGNPAPEWLAKAEVLRVQAQEKVAEWKSLQKEGINLAELRPQVVENEAMREQQTLEAKMMKERDEAERKAIEESAKLRQDLLEKYGTAQEKLAAKQAREMDDAAIKTNGDIVALDQLKAAQAVERKRLDIDDAESSLKKAGKDPGMSAGLDYNSSAGISAINKAIQGPTEQSVAAQQLEVEKRQLALMEQQARGIEISKGEQQLIAGEQLEPVLGEAELIAKIGPEDRQRRGAEFNKDSAEQLKVMKELLKANLEIARKSDRTVVKLSGS